ncbi:MAG: nucleoside triphosphate pyrophosphohydrolase [Elioraea sp.]|nr:nucleoside triphosphate pyrophosphohydrolase [Elioraea sp.]
MSASSPLSDPRDTAPGEDAAAEAFRRLVAIMRRLRDPRTGCPWDQAQTFDTIAPYTIEEAYEVADAIARQDWEALKDELGDLLLQVVYHARLAEERGLFDAAAVAQAIGDKMVRRHPHVFGDSTRRDGAALGDAWERHKAEERAGRALSGVLAGIPLALPALTRALKLAKRAASVGFDWPDPAAVLEKLAEETEELKAELAAGASCDRLAEEIGDMLFVQVNLARKLGLDPEACLRTANAKFERRFQAMEQALAREGKMPSEAGLEEMERLWAQVKRAEASVASG